MLKEYGITVNAFIDSDCKKWNKRIDDDIDVMVYGPELIEKDDTIIISTKYYHEIKELLLDRGIAEKKIFVDIRNSGENSIVPLQYQDRVVLWFEYTKFNILKAIRWRDFFWISLTDLYKRRKVILYGVNEFTAQFMSIFRLLDIEVIYCIDNMQDYGIIKKFGIDIEYRNVYELAYENMEDKIVCVIKVVELDNLIEDSDYTILEKLGLVFYKQIRLMLSDGFSYSLHNPRIETNLGVKREVLLGYTYIYKKSSNEYPGYIVLGNEKTASKRILILGGSTADVGLYEDSIKSWPEFLYDKLEDTAIFCGGIGGYFSKQELLKLLRDGKQISPDLVISYSGFNDMIVEYAEGYPYARERGRKTEEEVWGIKTNISRAAEWIESENMMRVIANEYGAKFIGIFQPVLINRHKSYMSFAEKIIYEGDWLQVSMGKYKKYQDDVKEKIIGLPYIYDMTELFLHKNQCIFRDVCHLTEEGNVILADAIYQLIQNYD